ncbi:hypothetical protein O3M35_007607 [Rhynocoris fuscipes]|uniref:AB hydrolase-1 domain-containing protein n=1 Tax=Rhynocoris fuscipes TaxID=488301 RepID=A0AAW1DCL6_9HEMI
MTEAVEIRIPVPWGHISGKQSGLQGGPIVLCLHGLQDNAGTFDRLIPLLPKNFQYIAIDMPGHGKSSHFDRGVPLVYMNYVFSIKLIVDYYKWNKIILLSHSFGAQISIIFAGLYPEFCEKIVLLDGLTTMLVKDRSIVKHYRRHFDEMQEVENLLNSKEPPSHSYEQALNRFINNRFSPISKESAKILMKRSLVKSGDGYRFSTDQRLKKLFRYPLNQEQFTTILENIRCPCFLIIAKDTFNLMLSRFEGDYNAYLKRLDLAQLLPNFTFKIVDGAHDVHLDNAPLVADNVTGFLLFSKSSM